QSGRHRVVRSVPNKQATSAPRLKAAQCRRFVQRRGACWINLWILEKSRSRSTNDPRVDERAARSPTGDKLTEQARLSNRSPGRQDALRRHSAKQETNREAAQ